MILRTSILALASVLSLTFGHVDGAPAQSVVEAFKGWTDKFCARDRACTRYTLRKQGVTYRASGGEFVNVARTIVDGPNGYLMIDDEGSGGGNAVTEAAIFRPDAGPALFVVARRSYEGPKPVDGTIRAFYWFDEGKLTAIENEALKIGPRDFVPGAATQESSGYFRKPDEAGPVIFHLPRKGTTIAAYLPAFDRRACVSQDWMGVEESRRAAACAQAARSHKTSRSIVFDRGEGRFIDGPWGERSPPTLR